MLAALRLIHPAPAAAVVALSAALGAILATQAGLPIDEGWALTVLAVAGSQVFTGATNDIADRVRDAAARPEKPIPAPPIAPQNTASSPAPGMCGIPRYDATLNPFRVVPTA